MNFRKRFFLFLVSLLVIFTIASCTQAADTVKVSFVNDEYTVKEGQELAVDIKIEAGSNLSIADIKKELVYSSSDENIAKFVDGKIIGVGYGETEIKVEWSEKTIVFDTAKVIVNLAGLPEVVFGDYSPNMLKGATQQISCTLVPNYTTAHVVWESANPEIATVDQNGLIKAVAVGEATIIASSTDGERTNPSIIKINVSESDFAINYHLNGGINVVANPAGYNTLNTPVALADPSKVGYTFAGWFADENFATPYAEVPAGNTGDVDVYAKWEVIEYAISYDMAGGENAAANPAVYTVEDEITFADPTKEGNKFLGWVDGDLQPITKIEKGSTGDVSVTATWEVTEFAINYELNGGHFPSIYVFENHLDMVQQFITEFNAFCSRDAVVTVNKDGSWSTNFFDRSWFGDGSSKGYLFLTDENHSAKWGWMLDIINENRVNRGGSPLSASDGQAEARGDIHNFLGLCDGTGVGANSSFGGDYSSYTFESYAPEHVAIKEGAIAAPEKYNPSQAAIIPDPLKDEHVFLGWGSLVTTIDTTANSGFWTTYASDVFLFKKGSAENPTFSFRVGLDANANGSYTVAQIAQSGETFAKNTNDLTLVISESHTGWAGFADFRAAVKLGQTVVVDGDLKTGKAAVSFYDIEAKPVATSFAANANSGFWGAYTNSIFLFANGSVTNPTFSFRVGIDKNVDGTYVVGEIGQDGDSTFNADHTFVLVISSSHANWADMAAQMAAVKVGQYVEFDGDPKTGSATVNFINNYFEVAAGKESEFTMNAVWVKIKDEHSIEYHLNDGTTEDNLPATYLTSTGLQLTAVMNKVGYSFKGWSLSADGEIITAIPEGTRGDIDLYAIFEVIDYAINYEMNGGAFTKHDIDNLYENFDELTADFISDYSKFYGLSNVKVGNFLTKSASFGIKGFFADKEMGAKWAWMVKFMLAYNPNYSGLSAMKSASNVANYNKTWCANIAAFLQQGKLSTPLTMDFTGIDNEKFYNDNGLKKEVIVEVEYPETYNVEQLPLALATPMRDGHTFVGWCDNEFFKRPTMSLAEGYLGEITLYAMWDDDKEIVAKQDINYVLDDGELTAESPVKYEMGEVTKLGSATKVGYKFVGWTLDAEGQQPVTEIGMLEREVFTVYAQWEIETYTIDYELPEGAVYKQETTTIVPNVIKSPYTATAATLNIDKVGTQKGLGEIAIYNGVILLKDSGWLSGKFWQKWGLVEDAFGAYKVVAYENGGNGGADFYNNNNCDYVLTAYDADSLAKVTGLNLTVGSYVMFASDPANCSTSELANLGLTVVTKNDFAVIDKVGTQKGLGEIAIYNGVILLKDSGWLSGKFWQKWGLVSQGNNVYKVNAYENGGNGGADFYNNNNCDYVLTAYDADSLAKVTALNLEVGSLVKFASDPAKCSSSELANLELIKVEEFESINVDKFKTQKGLGDIAIYNGVIILDGSGWLSGKFWQKWGLVEENGAYKVVAYENGGNGGADFYNNNNCDYVLTAYDADSLAKVTGLNLKVGDYVAFGFDPATQSNTELVNKPLYKITADSFISTTTYIDIEYPTTYTIKDLPLALVTPEVTVEGKKFVGFYTDENFYSEKLLALTIAQLGNIKLYGRIEDESWVEPVYSHITWELDGGSISEEKPIYGEGQEFKLEVPTKEGYDFIGWLLNDPFQTNYITEIPTTTTGDITLYAIFKPETQAEEEKKPLEVGQGKTYETISAALAAAVDGDIILLGEETYTLGEVVSKSVTFQGAGKDKTTINVTKDIAGNINADVVFDSVKLVGAGGGAGVPGVTFQAGSNIEGLTIRNSHITGTNTLVKFQAGENFVVVLENNDIDTIGQFIVWVTKAAKQITISGNNIDASTCGAVTNSAAALFRVRSASPIAFENNYVTGNDQSVDGLFEATSGAALVAAYNTFKGTTKYVHTATGNNITFKDNLFLDAEGAVLSDVPSQAGGNALASEADRALAYQLSKLSGNVYVVGAGKTYETISAALAAAANGDTIYLGEGSYTLAESSIAKDVTFMGAGKDKTVINVTKDTVFVNADVTFDSVKLVGAGGAAGVSGVSFQAGANLKGFTVVNSHITATNTFIKFQASSNFTVKLFNNDIDTIGQFIVWVTKAADRILIAHNNIDASSCGAIVNTGAALFRVRSASEVIFSDNYVTGNDQSVDGLFEATSGAELTVQLNTFKGTTKYVHTATGNNITFKDNLFLDAEGAVLSAAPTQAGGNALASEAARAEALEAFLKSLEEVKVYYRTVYYDLGDGKLSSIVYWFEEGTKVALPTPTLENYKFLGWTLEKGSKDYIKEISKDIKGDITLYANFRLDGITVGADQDYATLSAALNAAKDGSIIYLFVEDFTEDVEITKSVTIRGLDHFGNNNRPDTIYGDGFALIDGQVKISADNVTIDGVSFTGKSLVVNGNNCSILNCQFSNITMDNPVSNRYAELVSNKDITDLTVKYCAFHTGNSGAQKGAIAFGAKVSNLVVENNFIANTTSSSDICEAIVAYTIGGQVDINNNVFKFATDQFTFTIGDSGNSCGQINIKNNVFQTNGYTSTHTSGIRVQYLQAGAVCDIIGNEFVSVAGNTFNFKNSVAGSTANIMYNYFNGTAHKCGTPGSATLNYVNNYYSVAQTTATSDVSAIADKAALDDAYAAYQKAEESKVYSNISYVLNGGSLKIDPKKTYVEGEEIVLPTPSKAGYEFLGWSLTPDYAELITKLPATTTGAVTLYARLVKYANLTLNLNDGILEDAPTKYITNEVNALPTPVKDGYKFMGWYDNAEFAGEAVFEIAADNTADLEFFALWQIEGSFDVTYVLNGANTRYSTRQEMVDDFIADYCANIKKVTATTFFDQSYGGTVQSVSEIFSISEGKWAWMDAYFKAQETAGNVAQDFASDVAYIRANIHNFLNASKSSAFGMDFSSFEVANGFWGTITTEDLVVEDATEIYNPSYPFHTFLGWYDNKDFNGNPVRSLTADCTLYAKWEVTESNVIYVLNNSEANMDGKDDSFNAMEKFELPNPSYNDKLWQFDGWYSDEICATPITEIPYGTCADIKVYAKWTQILGYKITYVLNGGSLKYDSRDAVIADFLKDYNEACGHNYTSSADVPTGSWENIDFHTFFEAVLADGTNCAVKWWWLAEYIYDMHCTAPCGASTKAGIKCLIVGDKTYPSDGKYGLSYAMRGFLAGTTIRPGGSWASVDFSNYEYANGFWSYLSKAENGVVLNNPYGEATTLKTAYLENMKLEGWYTSPTFEAGTKVTTAEDEITVYAKWVEATPVTGIQVTNKPTELKRFEVLQLEWSILPADAKVTAVSFETSDASILTVTSAGLLEACGIGTATITIKSKSSSGVSVQFDVEVYSPDHFEISYETESYVEIAGEIQLNAEYISREGGQSILSWESKNTDIATVDNQGKVTGVAAGLAQIRCSVDPEIYVDFYVTVLEDSLTDVVEMVVGAHNSNAFARYNLGVGAGGPAYYRDIIGSVSKLLFNDELEINREFEATQAGISTNHGGKKSSTEFIVVHYTGNMAATSRARNNAEYFAGGGGGTSIHYVTGNDGVFHCLDDSLIGYHAGDGTNVPFTWSATGVKVPTEGDVEPVWGLDASGKYTINGQVTSIDIPQYDMGLSTASAYAQDPTNSKWINKMGLPWKIVGDEYYMGTTWWCYTQIAEGRLCSKGGNLNSIGIESAVNPESDLWYTWQKTAQLVARLMKENSLDITRVKGHHFFSGKDCPQPLLENDCEIWKQFLQLVEYEYEKLVTYADYSFEMKIVNGADVCTDTAKAMTYCVYGVDRSYTWNSGRIMPNEKAQVVTYTVTIKKAGEADQTITLATAVNSIYSEDDSTPISTHYMGYFK